MARPLRIEYPGAFYHVMHRGNAGSDIFKSVRDREKFLELESGKSFQLREAQVPYSALFKDKKGEIDLQNSYFWS